MDEKQFKTLCMELTRKLTDEGKLVEAGWIGLRMLVAPENAPQEQLDAMRNCFFAGAHHLFTSVVTILEPGTEATEKDMDRMSEIASELEEYIGKFKESQMR